MKLTASFRKGEKYIIARCPELGVTTQGRNMEEARHNLKEATGLHVEAMIDYMLKHGKVKVEKGKILAA